MKGAWRAEDEGLGGNVGENTTGTACTNVTDKDLDRPSGVPNELLGVPLVDFDLPGDEVMLRTFVHALIFTAMSTGTRTSGGGKPTTMTVAR